MKPVSHLVAEHGAAHPLDRSGPAPQAGLDTTRLNLSTERIDYRSRDRQQAQNHSEDLVHEPLTESLASPGHQDPQHRPDSPTLTTAAISAPAGNNGFSDSEESSRVSWSDEYPQDGGIHSDVSEAVAPAPHPTRYDAGSPSSYLSNTDLHESPFNHPGEAYIEEGERSGLEPLHPSLSDVEKEGKTKERLGHTPDFDENPSHLVQEASVQPTEPGNVPLDVSEEHAVRSPEEEHKRAAEEDENGHLSAQESEHVTGAGQEVVADMAGSDTMSNHSHDGTTDSDNGNITLDVSELQPTNHTVLGTMEPTPSQGANLSLDGLTASSEHESHDAEHNEPREHEESLGVSASFDHHEENQPSPELPKDRAQDAEHEEQTHHPDHGVYHPVHRTESEKDYDTDTDSQRFVTPLPSRHSLRTFSQQQQANLAHNTDVDDYVGSHDYASDDARKYELEHQHAATVHGEDDLFDDTDRSEDHAEPEDVGSERPNTGQQGAPVWRPVLGYQVETAEADIPAFEQESPELRSPESYARNKSWAEEVEGYFENEDEDEPESQPEMPSFRPNETGYGSIQSGQDSPVRTGLVSSEHHHERPETPAGHESLVSSEYVTPETLATRDTTTNVPWRVSDGWTPQSQDTQSTFSSPPVSPVRSTTADKSEPVPSSHPGTEPPVHHYEPQRSPHPAEQEDPFIDETERKTPVNLMPPWQRRGSPGQAKPDDNPHNEDNTGSLFRRMRNMFEQPRSNIPSRGRDRNRDFYASSGCTRPASGAWFSQPADPPPTTQKRFSSFHPPTTNTDNTTHHGNNPEHNPALSPTPHHTNQN